MLDGDVEGHDVNNKFVRVLRDSELGESEKDKIVEVLMGKGAISVEFRFSPKEKVLSIQRVDLSEEKGFQGILEDYVNSDIVPTKDLDISRLITVGKNILSEVIE